MGKGKILKPDFEYINWKKMYLRMVDSAVLAIEMNERGEYERAKACLVEAMNACEDMYIESGE